MRIAGLYREHESHLEQNLNIIDAYEYTSYEHQNTVGNQL